MYVSRTLVRSFKGREGRWRYKRHSGKNGEFDSLYEIYVISLFIFFSINDNDIDDFMVESEIYRTNDTCKFKFRLSSVILRRILFANTWK